MILLAAMGTPCGGTWRVGETLRRAGIDVGHEHMSSDGIVCGFFPWGLKDNISPEQFRFKHVVRYIRCPLATSQTLAHHCLDNDPRRLWFHKEKRVAALRRWVLTHERIRAEDFVIRVSAEHFEHDFAVLAHELKIDPEPQPIRQRSKRPRMPPISWSDWHHMDPRFAERGQAICDRHGLNARD